MSLFKLFLPTIGSIGLLIFTGCGESKNNTSKPIALGEAISITNKEKNATMAPAPSTLKSISENIVKMVKVDVISENQKEATSFTKETRYCDVSGVKEFEYQGTLQNIKKLEKFDACKTTQHKHNGYLTFKYTELDNDGKYPKVLNITVNEDYTFNNIFLKKGSHIESQISYNRDKSIKTISIKVNGVVTYQYGTYRLINNQRSITF